ncbi:MAG: PTS cellobiose transporter subunit IIC [Clostridium sp.]|uniref:PTS cellobiose transporter subunit IIC n=1 Tax=Clostridium sp. TaxID=1506 RepID=UPI0025810ED2|nr:PTS cellobiose transporter subunit IIC [Clostridium sp.]MDU7149575.1 PTS cellobiose transporter subunit IIC [Clostridium sp.]MDU7242887.1 PTS cellobiose transporter subunit IIC [Clostridium sp.]
MQQNVKKFMDEKLLPWGVKIGGEKHLVAIRDGLVTTMPLIIVGSIFVILSSIPWDGFNQFIATIFGSEWQSKLDFVVGATFNIMALLDAFTIAYSLANSYKVSGVSAGILSVATFLLVTPTQDGGIQIGYLGSKGLFVAIIVGLISAEIFRIFVQRNIVIKLPENVPPAVSRSFVALIPSTVCLTLFWIIRLLVETYGNTNIHDLIYTIVGKPISVIGGGFIGGLLAILFTTVFWSVGIHGWDLVLSVMQPTWLQFVDENRIAFQSGEAIPHIINYTFMNTFVWIGGSGVLLGLAILLFFKSKSKYMKEMGKIGLPPTVFAVNEPLMFGLPVVMNPIILIPYVIAPIVCYIISYVTMSLGIVAKAVVLVPWSMPPIIGGYLATGGHVSGVVLQIVNIIISIIIYYPFFKIIDRKSYIEENEIKEN